jgi:hypothetical protein
MVLGWVFGSHLIHFAAGRSRISGKKVLWAAAMFFYLVHRLVFEVLATYFVLRGFDGLAATYRLGAAILGLLYPMCRWYRTVKAAHPSSFLRYL